MFYPDFKEVQKLAAGYRFIPVSLAVYADTETPISLFKRFEDDRYCFLLESVEGGEKWGRYSFIGRNPFLTVKSSGRKIFMEYNDGRTNEAEGDPAAVLKDILEHYKSPALKGIPRFSGGAAGYFGYDVVRCYEELPNVPRDDLGLPESCFMLVDEVLAFDHLKQKTHIIVNMRTEGNLERNYNTAAERLREIYKEILASRWKTGGGLKQDFRKEGECPDVSSSMSREEYLDGVLKAKEYIRNGDIFQVVLSQRLCIRTHHNPFDVYRVLRTLNPSPYMYYFNFNGFRIAGSSPEMLVRVEDGVVETCPIAGTRKRGATEEEDARLSEELLSDEKELAEHTMLVDLARNDIGRTAEFGTVAVMNLKHVEKFSHVMHIVSSVKGELKSGKTAFDALAALLPAGTLSGAPKIRAMEIIDELEKVKRGPYGGAAGYIGFDGRLDSCILIRTILFMGGMAYMQAGAGIVADSVPEKEYEETLNKAGALLKALEEAERLL